MAIKEQCASCKQYMYDYREGELENIIIACGVKYMGLIQSIEQAKKVRLTDEQVVLIWELMIDLGVEKIA